MVQKWGLCLCRCMLQQGELMLMHPYAVVFLGGSIECHLWRIQHLALGRLEAGQPKSIILYFRIFLSSCINNKWLNICFKFPSLLSCLKTVDRIKWYRYCLSIYFRHLFWYRCMQLSSVTIGPRRKLLLTPFFKTFNSCGRSKTSNCVHLASLRLYNNAVSQVGLSNITAAMKLLAWSLIVCGHFSFLFTSHGHPEVISTLFRKTW